MQPTPAEEIPAANKLSDQVPELRRKDPGDFPRTCGGFVRLHPYVPRTGTLRLYSCVPRVPNRVVIRDLNYYGG